MSPKNSLLAAGLTALGMLGSTVLRTAEGDDVPAVAGTVPNRAAAAAAPATAPSLTVHLLSNGRVLFGSLQTEGAEYVLRQRGGVIRFKKDQVEKSFPSLADAYAYRRSQIPDGDPDEHLKLARWCLFNKLEAEAKVELEKVVAVSPSSLEAKAMLASLEAKAERLAEAQQRDASVVQAGATSDMPATERPASRVNPDAPTRAGLINEAFRGFELQPAAAGRQLDYFIRYVQPILQASCIRCHNEQHSGSFQLVALKTRRDNTYENLRANLETTLGLVDPANPGRSELLTRSLVPHGGINPQNPIFRGSGDLRYQRLATWVNALRRATTAEVPTSSPRDGQVVGAAGFASERTRGAVPLPFTPTPSGAAIPPPGLAAGATPVEFGPPQVAPATRYVPGRGMVVESTPPAAGEFPVSPLVGGPNAVMPRVAGTPAPPVPPGAATSGLPGTPGAPLPPSQGAGAPAPGVPPAAGPATADASLPPPAEESAKKPSKPVKIDPALLQRALINRNGGR